MLTNRLRTTQQGASLIEIMFAVAVTAVITLTGFAAWQQYINHQRVKQTANELQTWLDAGTAYYLDNAGRWPTDITDLQPYLPDIIMKNPWGDAYGIEQHCITHTQTSYCPRFEVNTTIPANVKGSTSLAERIVNRLAGAEAHDRTIHAQTVVAGFANGFDETETIVADVHRINNQASIMLSNNLPTCPEPLQLATASYDSGFWWWTPNNEVSIMQSRYYYPQVESLGNHWNITSAFQDMTVGSNPPLTTNVIFYCQSSLSLGEL